MLGDSPRSRIDIVPPIDSGDIELLAAHLYIVTLRRPVSSLKEPEPAEEKKDPFDFVTLFRMKERVVMKIHP